MARGVNKAILIGRVGKDPDCSYTQGGLAVVKFSIATSEEWIDKASNEKKERTEWHRIVCFGKLGEICGKYLTKGSQVYVEGKLQTRSWEQDGVTRYRTEIVIDQMRMLGGQNQAPGQAASSQAAPAPAGGFDDDIPF